MVGRSGAMTTTAAAAAFGDRKGGRRDPALRLLRGAGTRQMGEQHHRPGRSDLFRPPSLLVIMPSCELACRSPEPPEFVLMLVGRRPSRANVVQDPCC